MLSMTALLAISCEKSELQMSVEDGQSQKPSLVNVLTRSVGGNPLDYPVSVYAFAPDGSLSDSQIITSEGSSLSLNLSSGQNYHLTAISATGNDYIIEDVTSMSSAISMKSDNAVAGTALQTGFAEITPSDGNCTTSIQMNYCVASIDVALSHLPNSCTSVRLGISSVSKGITLGGDKLESTTAMIECHQEDGVWKSARSYLFPSDDDQIIFTIAYSNGVDEHSCTVTYNGKLQPGTPYNLNGNFTDGTINVTGDITAAEWSDVCDLNFTFGPNINPVITDDGSESDNKTLYVSEIPAVGSVWEGHVVAISSNVTDKSAELTLLSLEDWSDMTSATNATTPDMAKNAAAGYEEYGLKDWRIPTEEEGRALYSAYNSSTSISEAIGQAGGKPIVIQENSKNVRYLCSEAVKTFSFSVNSVTDAGATTKNYHLRLVRTVQVEVR